MPTTEFDLLKKSAVTQIQADLENAVSADKIAAENAKTAALASENAAASSESASQTSAANALASENAAASSESASQTSAANALASKNAAASSETTAVSAKTDAETARDYLENALFHYIEYDAQSVTVGIGTQVLVGTSTTGYDSLTIQFNVG